MYLLFLRLKDTKDAMFPWWFHHKKKDSFIIFVSESAGLFVDHIDCEVYKVKWRL